MATRTPNLNLYMPDATDDFGEFREEHNDNMVKIDNAIGGGGGSGGHTIVDENGADMPAESKLQFTGAVSVTDDNVNGATVVDVLGGGGSNLILDAQIYSTEEKQVGVWTDKKPLYCKTVQTAIPNNSQASYPHNIADIDTIVRIEGGAWGSNQLLPVNMTGYVYNNNEGALRVTVTKTNVVVMPLGWDGSGYTGYWNIYYTKTTDVAGSGGYEAYGFSPVIYSDVERVIGVWRDNKPLYQRTIYIPSLPNATEVSYPHNISDLERVVEIFGVAYNSSGYSIPIIFANTASVAQVTAYTSATDIYIGTGMDRTSFVGYITLRYTKTTDIAGSGDYNTYGVPTVHYSTSEQVIGTWTNGKPRYQITLEGSGSYPSGTELVVALPNDADKVVIMGGYVDIGSDWLPIQLTLGLGTPSTNGIYCYPNKTTGLHIYSSAWTFTEYSVTVQYCKTTD